jgi:FtsH-binding integral membrane protein
MGLITTSLVQLFLPFSSTVDLAIACFSVVLFSGFILYDTQQIMKRMSVDESVIAAMMLYVDLINLFLSVLRVVSFCVDLATCKANF